MQRGVARQVKSEGSFTNRRSCGKDDEIRCLPSVGYCVERSEAGRNSGHIFVPVSHVFDALNGFDEHGVDTVKVFPEVIVRDLEKFAFGVIEEVKYICAVFISIADDFATDANQFTLNEFLQNDTCVRL